MIIDIGGGTTEIAVVLFLESFVISQLKWLVMCLQINYIHAAQHNLYVGERTAEQVRILIGSALEEWRAHQKI